MAESADVARVVARCEERWRRMGLSRSIVAEMRLELTQHLEAAAAEGRSPDSVVGPDPASFADSWASAYLGTEPTPRRETSLVWGYAAGALALVAGAVAGSLAAGGTDPEELGVWRWLWTLFALGMGIGEIFTAGFFLLPFAIGSAAAALLAWLGVAVLAQWLVFFGVSLIALVYLRRFIDRQDSGVQPRVGANRWIDARGVVLEDIDPDGARGLVRVEGEEWRAVSDRPIPAGSRVVVREVRGARLYVVPIEKEEK
ncbi:MAG: hypothetical protein KatS3mg011_1611 [Acidimicrobiia bacterium]|nr:MAG: hypothetical protein KatS3mg011_1611 [Acidimicrobiia bacterium]